MEQVFVQQLRNLIRGPGARGDTQTDSVDVSVLLTRISEMRTHEPEKGLRLLDVGCGQGTLPAKLSGRGVSRGIAYTGVDTDQGSITFARAAARSWRDFASKEFRVGELDLLVEAGRKYDLVVCQYTIHELAPISVAGFVGHLLSLTDKAGRVNVIDMERIPSGENEACGIPWTGEEFAALVKRGGGVVESCTSFSRKETKVFDVAFRRGDAPFDVGAAQEVEREWVERKLCTSLGAFRAGLDVFRTRDTSALDGTAALAFIESAIRSAYIGERRACEHGADCSFRSA